MMTLAEAPSESWLALPAVMNSPCWMVSPEPKTGFRDFRPSSVVSARLPSSFDRVTSFREVSPVALSITSIVVDMGAISASSRPSAWAWAVRCCERRAYSSWASRLMP